MTTAEAITNVTEPLPPVTLSQPAQQRIAEATRQVKAAASSTVALVKFPLPVVEQHGTGVASLVRTTEGG